MDNVFKELTIKDNLSTIGFAIMILNLIKVLQTTRAHPRVGVLVATVIMGCVLKRGFCGERCFELCVGEFVDLCLCTFAKTNVADAENQSVSQHRRHHTLWLPLPHRLHNFCHDGDLGFWQGE